MLVEIHLLHMTLGRSQKPNSPIPTLATTEHFIALVDNQGTSYECPKLLRKAVLGVWVEQEVNEWETLVLRGVSSVFCQASASSLIRGWREVAGPFQHQQQSCPMGSQLDSGKKQPSVYKGH